MTTQTLLKDLKITYKKVSDVVSDAKKQALKYEVFMSELEHKAGNSRLISDIDSYIKSIKHAANKNN